MFSYRLDADTVLRLMEDIDAEALHALLIKNRERLYWLKPDYSFEDTKHFISRDRQAYAENNGFRAGIWVKQKLVGSIRYNDINWPNRSTELGYWIDAESEGKGLIGRSCRVFIDYAFDMLGLNRVEIRCNVGNPRSSAIAERLGFRMEGIARESFRARDVYLDTVIYAMLASEWRASKESAGTFGPQ